MSDNLRLRRLQSEFKEFQKDPPDNCSVELCDGNINKWNALIFGPVGSPYQNGIFVLSIEFGDGYPFSPPICVFKTYVYHPNINRYGSICLDILKQNWTPAISVSKLLISIVSLLDDPNPDDPLDTEIANLYKTNIDEFKRRACEYTLQCANLPEN